MKHIIAVGIMAISVLPLFAQDGDRYSDKPENPQQSMTTPSIQDQEFSSSNKQEGEITDKQKLDGVGGVKSNDLIGKDNKKNIVETASSQFQAPVGAGTGNVESNVNDEEGGFNGIEQDEPSDANMTEDFNQTTTQSDNQNKWGLVAFFVAVISLLVASYNYFTLHPKKNNKKGQHSRQQSQTSSGEDFHSKIMLSNQELQSRTANMLSRVENLESQLNRIEQEHQRICRTLGNSESTPSHSLQNGYSLNQGNPNNGEIKLYASQVLSDSFPEEGLAEVNGDYVIAILTVKGDAGTFIINDKLSAQSFLISNFAYGAGRVSDVKQQGNSPTRIETIQSGKIRRETNGWKILSNAQVKLI